MKKIYIYVYVWIIPGKLTSRKKKIESTYFCYGKSTQESLH